MTLHIIIADDHPLFRTALIQTIENFSNLPDNIQCISCNTIEEVHKYLESDVDPDLVLLDLHMPGTTGFAGLVNLRGCFPEVPVAMISGDDSPKAISHAEQLGAIGYVSKSLDADELEKVIGDLLEGVPRFDKTIDEEDEELQEIAKRVASLTPHQFRVFSMLSQGMLNKQIAFELDITETTVKSHVTAILRKLGLRKRTEVILMSQKFESPATDE
ncbi:MAG: response regulator transcription factor [Agarilytica sp.]